MFLVIADVLFSILKYMYNNIPKGLKIKHIFYFLCMFSLSTFSHMSRVLFFVIADDTSTIRSINVIES